MACWRGFGPLNPCADRARPQVPRAVWALSAGGCAAGTSEFMPAGLLPEIASSLNVSLPVASAVVSVFAVGMIIGALGTAAAAACVRRKRALVIALLAVSAGHVAGAWAGSFAVLAASRGFSAVAIGVFWTLATQLAVDISPPLCGARAVAQLMASMVIANLLGVPLGEALAHRGSWRAAFAVVAVICVGAALVLAVCVKEPVKEPTEPTRLPSPTAQADALMGARLLAAYVLICLYQGAVMGLMTFIKPLLLNSGELDETLMPWALAIFGLGGFFGLQIAGRYADQRPQTTLVTALAGTAVAALGLGYGAGLGVIAALACMGVFGVSAFAAAPPLNMRAFALNQRNPILASAGNTAAFNAGNLLGPSAGGLTLTTCGITGPAVLGAALAGAALLLAVSTPVNVADADHRIDTAVS